MVSGSASDDTIYNHGVGATVQGLGGNDYLINFSDGVNVIIQGNEGNDSIRSWGANTFMDGGEGNDSLYAGENNVIASGGNGDDNFINYANNVSMSGGAGNDYFENTSIGDYSTINGGAGSDTISLSSYSDGNLIQYTNGDGYDIIYNFNDNDTLSLDSSVYYSRSTVGSDLVINTNGGTITLVGAAYTSVNIVGSQGIDTYSPTLPPNPTPENYVYTGGDMTISDYQPSKQIIVGMLPTDLNFIGNNFHFYSKQANGTEDELIVMNVMDQVIDIRDGYGGEFAKAYAITNPGIIDGRASLGVEYLVGSSAGENIIYAGNGDSRLWGNIGTGADTLIGGTGYDIFFVGKNDGNDMILSAASTDDINLYDVQMSDIVGLSESNGLIAVTFNTGSTVQIQSTDALSAKFIFTDGTVRFNHSTRSWQYA